MTDEPIDCVRRLLRDAKDRAENSRTERNIDDALELLDAIRETRDDGPPSTGSGGGEAASGTGD